MPELPEKIEITKVKNEREDFVVNHIKGQSFLYLTGKQAKVAVHRHNIHKRLVDALKAANTELTKNADVDPERFCEGEVELVLSDVIGGATKTLPIIRNVLKEAQDG